MKKMHIMFIRLAVVMGVVFNLINCANPVDDPPLSWRSRVVIPLTNERFMIGEQMDTLFDFKDEEGLSVVKDDTLSFAVSRLDSASYERTENTFDTMFYRVKMNELTLQNIPDVNYSIPYAVSGKISLPVPIPLVGVREIAFSNSASNMLSVTMANNTDQALDSVTMTIANVGVAYVQQVASGSEGVFTFDMKNKTVTDTLKVFLAMESSALATGTVDLRFSLNGLDVFSAEVQDSLIAFTHEYINRFDLTDTMDLDYVDIYQGRFVYTILNHTALTFNLQCIHDHIWSSNFSKLDSLDDVSKLATIAPEDSIFFNGGTSESKTKVVPNATAQLRTVILSGSRLFPEWNDSLKRSVTNVRYTVEVLPVGKYTKVSVLDSLQFMITTSEFAFEAMAGTMVEPIEYEVDTQKVAIKLPWQNTVKDSLRGRFVLSNVWADLDLRTRLSGNSQIDTLDMDIYAFAPESMSVQNSLSTRFVKLNNDSSYTRSIDITDVANLFSDSIGLAVRMKIPVGTYVRFISNVGEPLPPGTIGRMLVDAYTDFTLNAKLDWKVESLVNMDLGTSRFPLLEEFRFFRKMADRIAEIELWVRNNSNLNVSLFSLVAPDTLMDTLDSLSMNEVYTFLKDKKRATENGYITLFDTSGITIPKRDTTEYFYSKVTLDEDQIKLMLSADSLNYRWWIQIKEQDRDALRLTDFIDIKSRLGIRGTNNTDSLLIWE